MMCFDFNILIDFCNPEIKFPVDDKLTLNIKKLFDFVNLYFYLIIIKYFFKKNNQSVQFLFEESFNSINDAPNIICIVFENYL